MSSDAMMTIDDVQDEPEEISSIVSPDYTTRENTPPGKYASEFRTVTFLNESVVTLSEDVAKAAGLKNRSVKVALFQVDLKGLVDRATGRQFRRPDRTWISTRPTRERVFGSRTDFRPGVTSDVQKYLSACGYPGAALQNLKGLEAIKSILDESQNRAVGVTVELAPRGKKTGTTKPNGKEFYRTPGNPSIGVFENGKKVYSSAFKDPANDGKFLAQIEVDGEVWEASEVVARFHRLGA